AGTPQRPEPVHASPVRPVRGEATDTRTNAQVLPGRIHVNHGFWDTYRTAWPAYVLLYPELTAELADGFVQQYREGGWIARWSSPGYADCMTGTSSDVAFADAHVKGVALPDPRSAYESGLRNATVAPPFLEVGRTGNERAVSPGTSTPTPPSRSPGCSRRTSTITAWPRRPSYWPRRPTPRPRTAGSCRRKPPTCGPARRTTRCCSTGSSASSRAGAAPASSRRAPRSSTPGCGAATSPRPTAGTSPSTSPTTGRGWPHCTG